MRRAVLGIVAVGLAFAGMVNAPVEAHATPVGVQHGYYDNEGAKVRYILSPKVASEVYAVEFDGKPARQARDGSWYRVMESQRFAHNHWIYVTIDTEAVEINTWVRFRNLY